MKVQSYQNLIVWQKAVDFVADIYTATRTFPKDEIYGLTSQLRRASVSVPSNIAEGQSRLSTGEFRQFLGNAKGSLSEIETQIVIALRLQYLEEAEGTALLSKAAEISRMLSGLIASLENANRQRASRGSNSPLATGHSYDFRPR
jgi:four helix bundle protein